MPTMTPASRAAAERAPAMAGARIVDARPEHAATHGHAAGRRHTATRRGSAPARDGAGHAGGRRRDADSGLRHALPDSAPAAHADPGRHASTRAAPLGGTITLDDSHALAIAAALTEARKTAPADRDVEIIDIH